MKKGDPITVVQEAHLILIECLIAAEDYVLAGAYKLLLVDEGITWLKGYHTPDEACVDAARTCQALREKEQPRPFVPQPATLQPWSPSPKPTLPLIDVSDNVRWWQSVLP